jgi:asparagine synthase (glutamine-hydrolysing)
MSHDCMNPTTAMSPTEISSRRATPERAVSGLVGVFRSAPGPDVLGLFHDMVWLGGGAPPPAIDHASDGHGGWVVGQAARLESDISRHTGPSGVLVFVHGHLYDHTGESPAAIVERSYRQHGSRAGEFLEGAFSAVVVDGAARQVLVINDLVGTFPVYWHARNGQFAFAPSLASITRAFSVRPTLDLRAAADYVHYGFLFGTKTLAAGFEMVPAGSTLVYDWAESRVDVIRNRDAQSLFQPIEFKDRAEYLEAVRASFNSAVARATAGTAAIGLSLSGGLDSRAILSALTPGAPPIRSYTVGVRLCADDVIGAKLAKIGRTNHRFVELGEQYLRDFLPNFEQMIRLTDGMYLSHGLTEMLALATVQEMGVTTLLRGHCGELAKARLAWPFHTDARVFTMRSSEDFEPYFVKRVGYVSGGVAPEDLFDADHGVIIRGAAHRSLSEAITGVGLSPADLCSYVYLTEHQRRFTVPSLELFRSAASVRLPFADTRFLRTLLGGRPEWRDGTDVHRHITGANNPRLLAVRNSNTGAPGSAGPLVERLLDPVNSVLKRLNAPGYRHYHRLDAWMRTELLSSVQEILLDGMTERRRIFRQTTIARLVDDTRAGNADHSHLLQVLLILELWQRQQAAAIHATPVRPSSRTAEGLRTTA